MNDRYNKNGSENDLCSTGKKGPSSKPTDHLDGLGRIIQTIDGSSADGMSHHSKIENHVNKVESVFLNRKE